LRWDYYNSKYIELRVKGSFLVIEDVWERFKIVERAGDADPGTLI
jgi:hypothetical protein